MERPISPLSAGSGTIPEWISTRFTAFARSAASELRYHDFGGEPLDLSSTFDAFRDDAHLLSAVLESLAREYRSRQPQPLAEGLLARPNSLYRSAAALLLTYLFRGWMTDSDVCRSWSTKFLCVRLFDLLDDLVDEESIDASDARYAIADALRALTAPQFDLDTLRGRLAERLTGALEEKAAEVAQLVARVRALLHSAPQARVVLPQFRVETEELAEAQAVSSCLRLPRVEIDRARSLAEGFSSPAEDVPWEDRYVGNLSWVGALTLIDLAYASRLPEDFDLDRHSRAWYYFDILAGAIDHFIARESDLGRGIVNAVTLALAFNPRRESRAGATIFPLATMEDYERLFARWAEYTRRALSSRSMGSGSAEQTYRHLAVLIPLVMFHQDGSEQKDSLHAYLRVLASTLRGEPGRVDSWLTDAPSLGVTTPLRTRSTGPRRGRSDSSPRGP